MWNSIPSVKCFRNKYFPCVNQMSAFDNFIFFNISYISFHFANVINRYISITYIFMEPIKVRCPAEFFVTSKDGVDRRFLVGQYFVQNSYRTCITDKYIILTEIALNRSGSLTCTDSGYITITGIRCVPQKVTNTCFDFYCREYFISTWIIYKFT